MKIMVTSFRRSHARTVHSVPPALQQDIINPRLRRRLLDTRTSLGQSLAGSLLLSPGSWGTQGFVCSLRESISLVMWKFCNQIPLAFKVKFPGGFKSFCWIPRLGNLLWVPELLQKSKNFFGVNVLQFVGCLLGSSIVGLMVTSSKRTYATH